MGSKVSCLRKQHDKTPPPPPPLLQSGYRVSTASEKGSLFVSSFVRLFVRRSFVCLHFPFLRDLRMILSTCWGAVLAGTGKSPGDMSHQFLCSVF